MKPAPGLTGLMLLLASMAIAAAGLSDFLGVWHGRVIEIPLPGKVGKRYAVTIEILPGSISVDYPELGCGGTLQPVRHRGDRLGLRDALNYGLERCEGNGRTELQLIDGDQLAYRWFDARGRLRAKGRLQRQRQLLVRHWKETERGRGT